VFLGGDVEKDGWYFGESRGRRLTETGRALLLQIAEYRALLGLECRYRSSIALGFGGRDLGVDLLEFDLIGLRVARGGGSFFGRRSRRFALLRISLHDDRIARR
jgi:hypothetical protein